MSRNGQKPKKVLYIEDNESVQFIVAKMLDLSGYLVTCANNGKVGVEKAKSWQPDVIITDVRMPVMDGPTAIRALRSDPLTQHIPICVLSAWGDAKTRNVCAEAGADKFLSKPVDIKQVIRAIEALSQSPQSD